MKNILLLLGGILISASAHASATVMIGNDDSDAIVIIQDDAPNRTVIGEGTALYDILDVTPRAVDGSMFEKGLSNQDKTFSIMCKSAPLIKFSSCTIYVKNGKSSVISKAKHTARFQVAGADAALLYANLAHGSSDRVSYSTSDAQVRLDSVIAQFTIEIFDRQ